MLVVISPAKSLDFSPSHPELPRTLPEFSQDARALITELRTWSESDISKRMKLSPNLALLNWQRYQQFQGQAGDTERQAAIFAFAGDVYQGLDARQWTAQQLTLAQQQLRMLSGLYGLLRPLDEIEAYRLEMGTSLPVAARHTHNLYQFWQTTVTQALARDVQALAEPVVVNLASQEYAKAVNWSDIPAQYVEPQFYEHKAGKVKIISFYAKRARGWMAKYVVQHRIKQYSELLDFAEQGYRYDPERSTDTKPCFVRLHD